MLAVADRRLALPLLCCFCVLLCFCFKLPYLLLFGCLCSFCQPSSPIPAAASWRCWWWRPGKWPGWWSVAGEPGDINCSSTAAPSLLFLALSSVSVWFLSFLYSHSIFHRFKLPYPFSFQKPSLVQKNPPLCPFFSSPPSVFFGCYL